MADAESKIKTDVKHKRIRHAYARKEVYRHWIESPEYVYVNRNHQISGKEDYLRIGDIGKEKSRLLIERQVDCNSSTFAVIDRNTKRILISDMYPVCALELQWSLPTEYEVFRCHGSIPCHDILSEEHTELLCKIHLEYVIMDYTSRYLFPYYAVLKGKNVLHNDINVDTKKEAIKSRTRFHKNDDILTFIKKYKIKKYDWYNKTLNDKYDLIIYYPDCYGIINISLPTIKQIVTGTVFNKKQIELFNKKRFYTKYCYCRGIKFKDVDKYWNKTVSPLNIDSANDNNSYDLTYDQVKKFLRVNKVYWNDDFYNNDLVTWNDYIILTSQEENKRKSERIRENIEKSKQNELKAREELKKYVDDNDYIKHWRDSKNPCVRNYVEYKKFIEPTSKHRYGFWITEKLYFKPNIVFDNIQLKLYTDTIVTSNNGSVSIDEAIKCYKILQDCIEKHNKEGQNTFSFVEQNVRVGLYKLIAISYECKRKDNGLLLSITTWRIRISCHNIWLDDFEDFVRYYHLEEKFGIKRDNKNKPIKLKMK